MKTRAPDGAEIASATVNCSPAAIARDGETVVVKNPPAELDITVLY